ncbi:MFS transporter [Pandoraea terrae]|uniref:MFS transporter n=1 Tax=Pandoraea terrae TaxID=1537710 RepID=A0A5E4TVY9_9BURK|nr:cyanate transporter [Pandoraea terrae]VVD90754.1 MFS transporter [Pandoraea terrae]
MTRALERDAGKGTSSATASTARPSLSVVRNMGRAAAPTPGWALFVAIVAVGLTLRPTLTSVSPLLAQIRATTGMSFPMASMLTSLPVLAMGVFALAAAPLMRKIGERAGVSAGLVALAAACGMRFVADTSGSLLASALLAGIGIAVVQTLLPGVIKGRYGAARMTAMMGLYSAALMGGGGLGAALSPRVAQWTGDWRAGLGIWVVVMAFALIAWFIAPQARRGVGNGSDPAPPHPVRGLRAVSSAASAPRWFRHPRAWLLAVYFGLINSTYTSMVAWLPPFYQQAGMSAGESGVLLAWLTACQVISALSLPWLARRGTDRRRWLALALTSTLGGLCGFLLAPAAAPWLWVGAIGFGLGGTFALGLILTLDHHAHPQRAAELAAFVQGAGYLVAATSPFATGALRAMTGSFAGAWLALAASIVLLLAMTWRFDPAGYARAMA